jgi:RimJ/RimL family protein N-acetyltransferase
MHVTETGRLRLRQVEDADAAFILELLTDRDFLTNVGDRGVHDLPSAQRYLVSGPLASYRRDGFGLWLVELKPAAQAIGLAGLLRRDTHPDVEIGFALLPRFRRQGYALEAARAVLDYATGTLGLARVVALAAPGNARSIRILEALGMQPAQLVRFTPDGGLSRLFILDSVCG